MQGLRPSSRDLTADILSGIIDGVVVTDESGKVLIWNRAIEEMTGIAAVDAVGKSFREALAENPAAVSQVEKTLATGRSYSDYESELSARHRQPLRSDSVHSWRARAM